MMKRADRFPYRARILVAITAASMLVAFPAYAQMGGSKHGRRAAQKAEAPKPKADEKAYKAALDSIPDPKEKFDPWGVARPAASKNGRKPQ